MPPKYTLPGVSAEGVPLQKPATQDHSGENGPLNSLAWTWNALAILAFVLAVIGALGAVFSFINHNPRDFSAGFVMAVGGGLAGLTFKTISALLYVAASRDA